MVGWLVQGRLAHGVHGKFFDFRNHEFKFLNAHSMGRPHGGVAGPGEAGPWGVRQFFLISGTLKSNFWAHIP